MADAQKPIRKGPIVAACIALPAAVLTFMLLAARPPMPAAQQAAEKPAPVATGGLFVLAASDWGGQHFAPFTTKGQIDVARVMAREASLAPLERKLILSPGDNFYQIGIKNIDDARFKETFEDVYLVHPELDKPNMWRVVAGNRSSLRPARRVGNGPARSHASARVLLAARAQTMFASPRASSRRWTTPTSAARGITHGRTTRLWRA